MPISEVFSAVLPQGRDECRLSSVLVDDVHDSMMVRVSNKGFFPKSATVRRVCPMADSHYTHFVKFFTICFGYVFIYFSVYVYIYINIYIYIYIYIYFFFFYTIFFNVFIYFSIYIYIYTYIHIIYTYIHIYTHIY